MEIGKTISKFVSKFITYFMKTFIRDLTRDLIKTKKTELFLPFTLLLVFLAFVAVVLKIINLITLIFSEKKNQSNDFLFCPIRRLIGTKKYDEKGSFTEEYYRISIIKSMIKAGIPKENIDLNYRIRVGHKGKNLIIPDIVIKKNNGSIFSVAEIKKNSNQMKSAIMHQLEPAMRILDSEYGIYYDGTKQSLILKKDGMILKNFNFSDIPHWFFYEWKKK